MKLLPLFQNNETQSWILEYYKSKTKLNIYIITQVYIITETDNECVFKLDIEHPDEKVKAIAWNLNYRKHMTLNIYKSDLKKTLRDYKLTKIFE